MSAVLASAPGKIVLAGDYAVLEGAPAVVLALDRYAHARIVHSEDGDFHINAPDLDIHGATAVLVDGHVHWPEMSPEVVDRLRLVTGVLEALAESGVVPAPAIIDLDTRAFFAEGGGKLGLGSSAALTVALAAGVCAYAGHETPGLADLVTMHRAMQGGRGSGLDVATSLLGGVVTYRVGADQPTATGTDWPDGLLFRCVWSGRSASTGSALRHLAQWRGHSPAAYDQHLGELATIAQRIARACGVHDAAAMMDNVTAYAASLQRLGEAAGIDIVCAEHRAMMAMAADCGVAYKSCGAGGGDVGMALATDRERLDQFSRQAAGAGFKVLDVGMDRQGLALETVAVSNRRHDGPRTRE